jgi:hypothetical protein
MRASVMSRVQPAGSSLRGLLAALPLLASALPVQAQAIKPGAMVPFDPTGAAVRSQLQAVQTDTVEQFDPVARAKALAKDLPRRWSGTYLANAAGTPQTVRLDLASLTPIGQMLVIRGTMTIGSLTTPFQGNINAKSDQLDLLLLGDTTAVGLEPGGMFQGLQTFQLSDWESPRLTNAGGKLRLTATARR